MVRQVAGDFLDLIPLLKLADAVAQQVGLDYLRLIDYQKDPLAPRTRQAIIIEVQEG